MPTLTEIEARLRRAVQPLEFEAEVGPYEEMLKFRILSAIGNVIVEKEEPLRDLRDEPELYDFIEHLRRELIAHGHRLDSV